MISELKTQESKTIICKPAKPIPRISFVPEKKPIIKSYEERKAEIIGRMGQQDQQVRDSTDRRWIKCEICGKIGEDSEFNNYGGTGHLNLGECSECARKQRINK